MQSIEFSLKMGWLFLVIFLPEETVCWHEIPSPYRLEKLKLFDSIQIEGWAQDYSNSNIFLKPLFRGKFDPFVNNANLGAIAHTSNGT